MQLSDFQFDLPPALIARYPLAKRSDSRLLCVENANQPLAHRIFSDLIDLLHPGDLLVFNDTKVIPARLFGQKATGGKVELLVERILDRHCLLAQLRVSKPPQLGDAILLGDGTSLTVTSREDRFYLLTYQGIDKTILEVVEALGHIPLPPYIHRQPEPSDLERYQTVYAKHKGSVAAPTAGFHFDHELLHKINAKGVGVGYLTLHIGAGTFAPVRAEKITDHQMHPEYLEVSAALCDAIKHTKIRGKRVIAVGTTSLRALEAASQSGNIQPYQGDTRIFIYPGYQFHCVDALVTNLHLPGSTLLMLVSAFGGYERVRQAYQEAVTQSYRFYSYGDAMWLEKA